MSNTKHKTTQVKSNSKIARVVKKLSGNNKKIYEAMREGKNLKEFENDNLRFIKPV